MKGGKVNRKLIVVIATALSASVAVGAGLIAQASAWETEKEQAKIGMEKAKFCARCHGITGVTDIPSLPNLAGQNKEYLVKQLKDFRSGFRRSAPMREVALTLKNEEIVSLAAYFSSLKRP